MREFLFPCQSISLCVIEIYVLQIDFYKNEESSKINLMISLEQNSIKASPCRMQIDNRQV